MKLIYCVGSLDKPGGTEKVLVNKCNYFVNHYGYEVHIITVNQLDKSYCYDWDDKIIFHDIPYINRLPKILSLISIPLRIRKFRDIYSNIINKISPDIVIVSERGYLDFVIPFICKKIPKLREFHTSKKAIKIHANQMPLLKKWKHIIMYSILYQMFNYYDLLILLTKRDAQESFYKTDVRVVPNMIPEGIRDQASLENTRVISVGSMNGKIKDFDSQITMWQAIANKHPTWTLNIFGDGARRSLLQDRIDYLNLSNSVILHGTTDKIDEEYMKSSFSLFTSVGEGFGMVLIESMRLGVPCISFDCPHGPSEIINNGIDGYLIKPNDFTSFQEKIKDLIVDDAKRKEFGNRAYINVERFFPKEIAFRWKRIFEEIKLNNEN